MHRTHSSSGRSRRWPPSMFAIAATAGHSQTPARRVITVVAERFSFTPSEITVDAGEEVELRLKSDDTAHGFRIAAATSNVAIPKRGHDPLTVTIGPLAAGRYRSSAAACAAPDTISCAAMLIVRDKTPGTTDDTCDASASASGVWLSAAAIVTMLLAAAQSSGVNPGDPLPGLTPAEFEEFRVGPRRLHGSRDRRGRTRPGVQRHELRRVPQRSGGRRDRPRCSKRAPAYRDDDGTFDADSTPTATRCSTCSRCRRTSASRSSRRRERRRAPRADSAVRRGTRRSDSGRHAARARGSVRSRRQRRPRSRRDHRRRRDRRASRRALRMEGAAGDAAGVQRRRLSQRNGHHQRPVPARVRARDQRRGR